MNTVHLLLASKICVFPNILHFVLTFCKIHMTGFVFGFVGCDEVLLETADGELGGLDEVDGLQG